MNNISFLIIQNYLQQFPSMYYNEDYRIVYRYIWYDTRTLKPQFQQQLQTFKLVGFQNLLCASKIQQLIPLIKQIRRIDRVYQKKIQMICAVTQFEELIQNKVLLMNHVESKAILFGKKKKGKQIIQKYPNFVLDLITNDTDLFQLTKKLEKQFFDLYEKELLTYQKRYQGPKFKFMKKDYYQSRFTSAISNFSMFPKQFDEDYEFKPGNIDREYLEESSFIKVPIVAAFLRKNNRKKMKEHKYRTEQQIQRRRRAQRERERRRQMEERQRFYGMSFMNPYHHKKSKYQRMMMMDDYDPDEQIFQRHNKIQEHKPVPKQILGQVMLKILESKFETQQQTMEENEGPKEQKNVEHNLYLQKNKNFIIGEEFEQQEMIEKQSEDKYEWKHENKFKKQKKQERKEAKIEKKIEKIQEQIKEKIEQNIEESKESEMKKIELCMPMKQIVEEQTQFTKKQKKIFFNFKQIQDILIKNNQQPLKQENKEVVKEESSLIEKQKRVTNKEKLFSIQVIQNKKSQMRDSLKKKTSTEETTSNPDKKKKKVLWFDKNINEAGYVGRNLSKMVDLKCFKKFDSFYDFLFKQKVEKTGNTYTLIYANNVASQLFYLSKQKQNMLFPYEGLIDEYLNFCGKPQIARQILSESKLKKDVYITDNQQKLLSRIKQIAEQ